MDKNWKKVASILPVEPCDDLQQEIYKSICQEGALGGNMLVYHRESVDIAKPLMRFMGPECWERRAAKRRWGARCRCTNCEEDFITGWRKDGIVIAIGEDGTEYSGWVSEEDENAVVRSSGDSLICPYCWEEATVTHKRELKSGRTYRVMQAEVVNAGEYTAVMFWMVTRYIQETGRDRVLFFPHEALIIDKSGKLHIFGAKRQSNEVRDVRWEPRAKSRDPMQVGYYTWDAYSISKRQIGGWTLTYGPDLDGHTGEKTALDKYIGAGGSWPGAYLHVWQKWPQVENLMRNGFADAVVQEIDKQLDRASYNYELCGAPPILWADFRETKPYRIMGMTKEAFRGIRKVSWSAEDAHVWMLWRTILGSADALSYEMCRKKIGVEGVKRILQMIQAGWNEFDPMRVVRYLEKKALLKGGVQHLIDYRVMLRDAGIGETAETLWPRDLIEAHDRVAETRANQMGLSCADNFAVTRIKLDGLEWTDGKLCIVIPKEEQELKDEGRILRHCVGTYGKKHCTGSPVFFVRRYRRPERSYYTLNIDMTGLVPKRIQLHGYGNERHGEHKQYCHTIPKGVLEFCDRWEREVLMPWWNSKRKIKDEKTEPLSKPQKRKKDNEA